MIIDRQQFDVNGIADTIRSAVPEDGESFVRAAAPN